MLKANTLIKTKYLKYLLVGIILLIVLLLLNKPEKDEATVKPTPTFVPVIFELKRSDPKNGFGAKIFETTAIEFELTKSLDEKTLDIKIEPNIEYFYQLENNNRKLFIKAVPWWEIGTTYVITINALSQENEPLKTIEYKLKIEDPEPEGITESFY